MTLGEYERLRANPNHFAVRPGHVDERVERTVEEHEHYVVVAKVGAGRDYAIDHDPRSDRRRKESPRGAGASRWS